MKLRTKLTVFSILLLAAAIALCCAIIISFAYQADNINTIIVSNTTLFIFPILF